jgi:hypothetical protein
MDKVMGQKQFIQVATSYIEQGFSVIPVGVNKKPLVEWKQYQSRIATSEEVERWSKFKNPNIGIVTGSISGIVVVDVEAGGSRDGLTPTVIANTGGGGWHFYYKHPGYEFKNSARKLRELTDIRGDGGYVVAPPSLHKSGKHYEWSVSPEAADFADIPDWVLQNITPAKTESSETNDWEKLLVQDNHEGTRNDMAAKVAGYLLSTVNPTHWDSTGWSMLTAWNLTHNKPSLPENELQRVWDSIKSRAELEQVSKSVAIKPNLTQELVEAIEASGAMLFYDQYHDTYIAYAGNGNSVSKINSKTSKLWLTHFSHTRLGKVASTETTRRALELLAAHAHFDGEQYALEVRSVYNGDGLWYDLGASAVHITENNWAVTDKPPVIFKRFSHQKPQVMPERGGNIRTLLNYINIGDEAEKLLFLVYVVAAFIPDFPHPLLILHGAQGAGKTTPMKLMKELIDPSALSGLSSPKNIETFVQTASHHSFLFYDNLSKMPEWFSDALARAATGDSFSKRELYSDDDDVIYSFQKTIALNGINQIAYKPDLLDRSILLNLQRITPDKRKEAQIFWTEFEADRPAILGAIFDVLGKALALYPTIKLNEKPRMADFTRWGCAIAEAAGFNGKAFIRAYEANIAIQHDEAIEANPVSKTIMELMKDRKYWQGTPAQLYTALNKIAFDLEISQSRGWVKDAARLGRTLTTITPNLNAKGIDIESSRSQTRLVTIRNFTVVTDGTDAPAIKSADNDDSTTATSVKGE